jgi:hypothetical protein
MSYSQNNLYSHSYLVALLMTLNIEFYIVVCGDIGMQRVTYCLECGIPLVKIEDFGGADPENRYCCNCTDENGVLLRKTRVQEGIRNFWSLREERKATRRAETLLDGTYIARINSYRK